MKIILTPEEGARRKEEKERIKKQNKTCPCCGENKDFYEYFDTSGFLKKGIDETFLYTKSVPFFKRRKTKIDYNVYSKYECFTCGAKWIGDPIPHYYDI